MKEPTYVAETLAWCNTKRKEQNKRPLKKLPKGKRYSPESCPCGAATGLYVSYGEYRVMGEIEWFPLLPAVRQFTRAFDLGRLPQYVK